MATALTMIADAAFRLTPEMTSRRLLVLAFVRDYLAAYGGSPSYGEIARALGISATRARQLVQALVASGQLLRRPGRRGITLPTLRDEALRQLRELGWAIDENTTTLIAPCANSTLPAAPMLDYLPSGFAEVDGGECSDEPGGKAAREDDGTDRRGQPARMG